MKTRVLAVITILIMILVFTAGGVMAGYQPPTEDPFIRVTSPAPGQITTVGSILNITWEKSSAGGVTRIFFPPTAENIDNSIEIATVEGTSYNWVVPDQVTDRAVIYLVWSGIVTRSGHFTIQHPELAPPDLGIPTVPAAPTELAANAVSASSINITWIDNAGNETGYRVERRMTNQAGGFIEVATLEANTTQYLDTGLSAMTSYTYRVRAYNNVGNSAFSNEAEATTQPDIAPPPAGVPAAPTELSAEALAVPAFSLNWTDNAANELAFHVERKTNEGNFEEIAEVDANVTAYVDEDVLFNTLYVYRVRARNASGFSGYSNETEGMIADPEHEEEELEPQPEDQQLPPVTPPEDEIIIRFFINQSDYYVNGVLNTMDTSPIISGGRTLLPIRYVAEALGATVDWDAGDQRVTIQFQDTTIELWINQNNARVNGVMQQIDPNNAQVTPVILPPGRTMLPLRFVAENLGSSVDWEPIGQEVTITYPAQ